MNLANPEAHIESFRNNKMLRGAGHIGEMAVGVTYLMTAVYGEAPLPAKFALIGYGLFHSFHGGIKLDELS